MMFQRPFLMRLSAANNLRLALENRSAPRRSGTSASRRALRRVGMADLGARPARALSGGEQQRLAIWRALGGATAGPLSRRADGEPGPVGDAGRRGTSSSDIPSTAPRS